MVKSASPAGKIVVPQHKLAPLIRASTVTPREMTWLWYPYIPAEAATLMYGQGGIGKSHITCAIATAVSRGDPFPGQDERRKPGKVLMLSAEDDLEVVLVPRLIKMGANLNNIFISPNTFVLDKQGLRDVEEYVRQSTAVVAFIDPIVAWVGGKIDINRSNDVRAMIGPLHTMAQQTGTAVVIVGHSRKGSEGEDYEKAMGSSDFTNAVRSTLYVTKTNDGTKIMKHAKSNYAPFGPPISFSFEDGKFEWGDEWDDGKPVAGTAKPRANAAAFLKSFLAAGPVPAKEVEKRAHDEGINMGTLNRAKVGVAESYLGRDRNGKLTWYWRLIGDKRNGTVTDISGVESGEQTEVPAGRGGPRDAVDAGPGEGDHRPDGAVGEGRDAEGAPGERAGASGRASDAGRRVSSTEGVPDNGLKSVMTFLTPEARALLAKASRP